MEKEENLTKLFSSAAFIILVWAFISWRQGYKFFGKGINDQEIIAISTIAYALFTLMMFWHITKAFEIQTAPLILLNYEVEQSGVYLYLNKITDNIAKDVNIRYKVTYPCLNNKIMRKLKGIVFSLDWIPLLDWWKLKKKIIGEKTYPVIASKKSESIPIYLTEFLRDNIPYLKEKKDDRKTIIFKLSIFLRYKSLANIKYHNNFNIFIEHNKEGFKFKDIEETL